MNHCAGFRFISGTKCAVVLIGHMNKGSNAKAAYRGMGSIDFYAIARSVLLVAKVPQNPNIRAAAQIKSNLATEGETMAFQLDENGFTWIGEYDISADELLVGYSNNDKHKAAEDFLKKILSNGQTVPASTVFAQAKSIGVSKRTIENVKQELAIKSIKDGASWLWKMD